MKHDEYEMDKRRDHVNSNLPDYFHEDIGLRDLCVLWRIPARADIPLAGKAKADFIEAATRAIEKRVGELTHCKQFRDRDEDCGEEGFSAEWVARNYAELGIQAGIRALDDYLDQFNFYDEFRADWINDDDAFTDNNGYPLI